MRRIGRILSALSSAARAFGGADGGNVAVIFAVASIALIGTVGVAIDYSRLALARSQLQDRLDAALIAGVQKSQTLRIGAAEEFFDGNTTGSITKSASRVFQNEADGLSGTATAAVPSTLSSIIGVKSFDVSASGRASAASGGQACILVNSATASQALLLNSGASIQAPDCEIHVRSTANPAAIVNSGVSLGVKRVCIAGATIIKNTSASMPIETSCAAVTDTIGPTLTIPTVGSCTKSGTIDPPPNGIVNLTPGVYCNLNFNGSPTINLSAGLYVIKGTVIINSGAKLNGSGVTFYFPDTSSELRFNGGVVQNISAPTSGTYSGILMFENPNSTGTGSYTFNGSSGDNISGVIYLARRNVTYNSVSNINAQKISMVVNTLILNSTKWTFSPGPQMIGAGSAVARLDR